eukprot:2313318-Rhodomonas_salina.1
MHPRHRKIAFNPRSNLYGTLGPWFQGATALGAPYKNCEIKCIKDGTGTARGDSTLISLSFDFAVYGSVASYPGTRVRGTAPPSSIPLPSRVDALSEVMGASALCGSMARGSVVRAPLLLLVSSCSAFLPLQPLLIPGSSSHLG